MNYLSLRALDLDLEDYNGTTILVHQVQNEQYTMASRLISRGANMNYVNTNGKTPLHILIEN